MWLHRSDIFVVVNKQDCFGQTWNLTCIDHWKMGSKAGIETCCLTGISFEEHANKISSSNWPSCRKHSQESWRTWEKTGWWIVGERKTAVWMPHIKPLYVRKFVDPECIELCQWLTGGHSWVSHCSGPHQMLRTQQCFRSIITRFHRYVKMPFIVLLCSSEASPVLTARLLRRELPVLYWRSHLDDSTFKGLLYVFVRRPESPFYWSGKIRIVASLN